MNGKHGGIVWATSLPYARCPQDQAPRRIITQKNKLCLIQISAQIAQLNAPEVATSTTPIRHPDQDRILKITHPEREICQMSDIVNTMFLELDFSPHELFLPAGNRK
jgi:hypothetical protein